MSAVGYGVVLEQKQLAENIFCLLLESEAARSAVPGQFVNLYMSDQAHLLPRPISVCNAQDEVLTLVYRVVGEGTAWLSGLQPKDSVRILGPLGNGYALEQMAGFGRVAVIGGGLGIPPMLYLAKELSKRACDPEVILGYRDQSFLLEEFQNLSNETRQIPVHIASDAGTIGVHGTVLDVLDTETINPSVVCACGPLPMLRALKAYCGQRSIPLFVSLEERMACGVGACLGCVCETADVDEHSCVHNRRVCKDGPVFAAEEVIL